MGKRKWIWWWKWGTIGAGTLLVAGVLGGWLLFQHIPDWYRPIEIPPDQQSSVAADCVNTMGGISKLLNESQDPFEFRLSQDQANAWLAEPVENWLPPFRWRLPPGLFDPQVAMTPDGLRVGVTFRQGSLQTVLVGHIEVSARPDGLLLRLIGASAGSLPVPQSKVRELLAMVDGRNWPAGHTVRRQLDDRPMPRLARLYDGILLPNAWIWPNGDPPFKITGIAVKAGEMVFTLAPLPRQPGRKSEPVDDSSIPIWNISPRSTPAGKR